MIYSPLYRIIPIQSRFLEFSTTIVVLFVVGQALLGNDHQPRKRQLHNMIKTDGRKFGGRIGALRLVDRQLRYFAFLSLPPVATIQYKYTLLFRNKGEKYYI